MKNDGGPAFPVKGGMCFMTPPGTKDQYEKLAKDIKQGYEGMSLRKWFAGQALVGFLFHQEAFEDPSRAASWAYEQADAMIAEGDKEA